MSIKIDLFSGFLGSGKTTLIQKLLNAVHTEERVALIENEFGEVSVDAVFLDNAAIQITEINAGCICCNVQGDFQEALRELTRQYKLDRIMIEPSGVAKITEVRHAVDNYLTDHTGRVNIQATVVDALNYHLYRENFSDFFLDQVRHAGQIVVSKAQLQEDSKLEEVLADLKHQNPQAGIITANWDKLTAAELLFVLESTHELESHHTEKDLEDARTSTATKKQFTSWTQVLLAPVPETKIRSFAEALKTSDNPFGEVQRVKAVFRTAEGTGMVLNYVPNQKELLQKGPLYEESRINVIGLALDKQALEDFWAADEMGDGTQ